MSSPRVLVTDGLNGTTLDAVGAVRTLHYGGFRPVVTVPETSRWTALSRHVDERVRVAPLDSGEFADSVRSEAKRLDAASIVVASEPALLALGVSIPELIDKRGLSKAAAAAGVQAPTHHEFATPDELDDRADELDYPVVVKPAIRTYKAFRADSAAQIRSTRVPAGAIVVQPFISGPMECVSGVMWRGRLHSVSRERWLRMWPRDCGLATASVTVEPDPECEAGLERLLGRYEGIFCAQFVGGRIIDLNLRSFLTIELAAAAGVNVASIHARLAMGQEVPEVRARPGVRFRWVSGDLKWSRQSLSSGDMSRRAVIATWRPRRGTVRPLFRPTDPMPFVGRLLDGYIRPVKAP